MSAAPPAQRPRQVILATPGDWFELNLPHSAAESDALLARLLTKTPSLKSRADMVKGVIGGLAAIASATGVVYAGGTFVTVDGSPLPVTLFINAVALGGGIDSPLQSAERPQASEGEHSFSTSDLDLPSGRAVQAEWIQATSFDSTDLAVAVFTTQYFITLPDEASMIVMTFSSPAVGLRDRLRRLFVNMAAALEVR